MYKKRGDTTIDGMFKHKRDRKIYAMVGCPDLKEKKRKTMLERNALMECRRLHKKTWKHKVSCLFKKICFQKLFKAYQTNKRNKLGLIGKLFFKNYLYSFQKIFLL